MRIKHFHNNRRLIASIATEDIGSGYTAIGIARCHKNDTPNRKLGSRIARERLDKLLAGKMTAEQLAIGEGMLIKTNRMPDFVRSNPFTGNNFSAKVAADFGSPVFLNEAEASGMARKKNRTHPIVTLGIGYRY